MKKLDKLLIFSFLPPFVMMFFIALFVLIMQFLWKYIDDIIGKGVEVGLIVELLFFRAMALVPMALPISVVVASVMVMGNLSERYELATMKSAGISLLRVMLPLIILTGGISLGSFYTSDVLIPYSNLKFKSLLFDIQHQKPAFNLEANKFNNDLQNASIFFKEKTTDGSTLRQVMIYDHSGNRGNVSQVMAGEGTMSFTPDSRYLIMELRKGRQYQEMEPTTQENKTKYEHLTISFDKWERVYDMSQFNMELTDEKLFKSHYSMLSSKSLRYAIDSMQARNTHRQERFQYVIADQYFNGSPPPDTTNSKVKQLETNVRIFAPTRYQPKTYRIDTTHLPNKVIELADTARLPALYKRALQGARTARQYAESLKNDTPSYKGTLVDYSLELHRKIMFALACMVFLFVGAPMGAIIRKGGFGWPILIAIIFFMVFIIINITGEKLAKTGEWTAWHGMYLPIYILAPIGCFLTYKATNDSKIFEWDTYFGWIGKLIRYARTAKAK